MRRALAIGAASLVGANAGYVSRQLLARGSTEAGDGKAQTLTVAAPLTSLLAAAAVGAARGPAAALTTGLLVALAAGSRFEETVPGLRRVYESGSRRPSASPRPGVPDEPSRPPDLPMSAAPPT